MADTYSAIYPLNSPGGWNLIGTTDVQMFDASAQGCLTIIVAIVIIAILAAIGSN